MADMLKQEFDNLQTSLSNAKQAINTIACAYGHLSFTGGILLGYLEQLGSIHRMAAILEADYQRVHVEHIAPPEPGAGKLNFPTRRLSSGDTVEIEMTQGSEGETTDIMIEGKWYHRA